MSTNYYARTNHCPQCGRADYVHLGKAAAGWSFRFCGSKAVRDFDAWCALVRSAWRIEDDADGILSAEEMIHLAQDWQGGKIHALVHPEGSWLDSSGYSFTEGDWS